MIVCAALADFQETLREEMSIFQMEEYKDAKVKALIHEEDVRESKAKVMEALHKNLPVVIEPSFDRENPPSGPVFTQR